MKITREQKLALKIIYLRTLEFDTPSTLTYRQFRRTVRKAFSMNCLMVPFANMYLGIEPDGYTHS